jgi:hypothetical protein
LLRLLVPLLPTLLRLLPSEQGRERVRRITLRVGLTAAAGVLAVIAFAFALAAFYMAMATVLTPPAAAAVVAFALLLLALLLVLIGVLAARRPVRAATVHGQAPVVSREGLESAGLAALTSVVRQIERKPVESVLIATVLGMVVSLFNRRR